METIQNIAEGKGKMRHVQYTLSDEEFLTLRTICVVLNTNMKAFTREAVLLYMKKYLSEKDNTSLNTSHFDSK